MPLIDRAKFNALLQNLLPSFVAQSKAMKDSLAVVHDTLDANYNEFAAYKAGVSETWDGGFITDTDPPTVTWDGGTI